MDPRQVALEKAMKLAAVNAEFYLPLKDTIVIPDLCAAVIALADEVRALRAVREDQAARIRRLQSTIEVMDDAIEELT